MLWWFAPTGARRPLLALATGHAGATSTKSKAEEPGIVCYIVASVTSTWLLSLFSFGATGRFSASAAAHQLLPAVTGDGRRLVEAGAGAGG